MTLRWFDIHSPHNWYNVGKIEVEGDKIKRTSPAYRWALGLYFEDTLHQWQRDHFDVIERFECNSKSFDSKKKYVLPAPSDSQLYHRVSP